MSVFPKYEAPAPGCPALAALRQATSARHAAIEARLALHQPFGLAHYQRVLQGFAAFLAVWDPAIARVLPARLQSWLDASRRLRLLQRDLASLQLPVDAGEPGALPLLAGLPEALGSMYVLEGSALGGQVIAAQVRQRLGLTPQRGAAYFHGAGNATAARWRAFQDLLATELAADAAGTARAARAACQTFDGLFTTFDTLLDDRTAA